MPPGVGLQQRRGRDGGAGERREVDRGRDQRPAHLRRLDQVVGGRWPDRAGRAARLRGPVRPNDDQNNEKGTATMKLTTTTIVTLDGVMQGLGAPDEDRRGGFERGGWAAAFTDKDTMAAISEVYARADAFLFGRRTYEIFAGSWGTWDDPGDSPVWTALNTRPKSVASTTLTDPQWARTSVLEGEAAAAVGALKAKPGGELQVHGSGKLVRFLFDNGLVDEMTLLTYPVVVGQGQRLFP